MTVNKRADRNKRWMTIAGLIVGPVLFMVVIGQFTPVPATWIMKPIIAQTSFAAPGNIETINQQVSVEQDLVYDNSGTPNGLLDVYYPKNRQTKLPVVMWIHGGGFISSDKESTRVYGMALAHEGYIVANINYGLAPAQTYPTPVIQANKALLFLKENAVRYGGDMNRLFIGGDSAGAQIASQVAAVISDARLAKTMAIQPAVDNKQLRGVLLYCGAYDMQTLREAHVPFMDTFMWAYTGAKEYQSYAHSDELSTVKHVTPGYPPTFLTVGDADRIASQSAELISVLKRNGVDVEGALFTGTNTGLGHEYQFDLNTRPAAETFSKAVGFLERHSK